MILVDLNQESRNIKKTPTLFSVCVDFVDVSQEGGSTESPVRSKRDGLDTHIVPTVTAHYNHI